MATGDGINKAGAYATVQAASSTADGAFSAGASTAIGTAIAAESAYFLLDFKVIVSVGTPVAEGAIHIYKRNSDQPAPTATYKQTLVGSAIPDAATGNYYLRGVVNDDPLDSFYMQNAAGATLTIALEARGRTYIEEA